MYLVETAPTATVSIYLSAVQPNQFIYFQQQQQQQPTPAQTNQPID
jgi:hypothetical protein